MKLPSILMALSLSSCVSIARCRGEMDFAEAEQNRRIKVLEAEAKKESAVLEAEAEVSRAEGAARANKILGESLKNNEEYLRYLWITSMEKSQHDTIYIPTEAGLPILEAARKR